MERNGRNIVHYIQPKYYKKFACIGGSCQMSCCIGWSIDWTKDAVEKIREAECSEHLKNLVQNSFNELDNGYYRIGLGENGRCPFLTEDNFCTIQREIGSGYFSKVCSDYPRVEIKTKHFVTRCCHLSCIHVIDMLLNEQDSMELEIRTKNMSENQANRETPCNEEEYSKHPELNYRRQIFELYYDIISNESHSLETSVNWGSYVSIKLTELVNKGQQQFIPEAITYIREEVSDKALSDQLEAIKPNYDIKLKFVICLHNTLINSDIFRDIVIDDNTVDTEKFKEGERRFNEAFADRPFALRNIALGLLMDLNIPFRSLEQSIFDNYCYFIASFVIAKLMGPAIFLKDTPTPELEYKKVVAIINRSFAHNKANIDSIIELLKQFRCDLPANLSAIIK